MSLLEARELAVRYGALVAVRDLSFAVERGKITALLGANGAGKSSVIRAINGTAPSVSGQVWFDDAVITARRPDQRIRQGIATVPEHRGLFRTLTVEENLKVGAYWRRDRAAVRSDLARMYDLFPALSSRRRIPAGNLSGGQGQMLAIGRALMAAPRLLLLDEPSHGLSPKLVDEVYALIPELAREEQLTVLLVEQNAHKALAVSAYAYVLESGRLALHGTTAELAADRRVKQLYLGG